jgi:hypothetical protein
MTNWPKTQAVRRRDLIIFELLEHLCRARPLNVDETELLNRTMQRLGAKQPNWRWSAEEDTLVRQFIYRRLRSGPPPLFLPNDEVRLLAARLGRSYMAVHRRMERIRKRATIHTEAPEKLFKRGRPRFDLESQAWMTNGQLLNP